MTWGFVIKSRLFLLLVVCMTGVLCFQNCSRFTFASSSSQSSTSTSATSSTVASSNNVFFANSTQLLHQVGSLTATSSWSVPSTSASGYLAYGPYTSSFQNGIFKASFRLRVDNNSADDLAIAYVDVNDTVSQKVLAHREIHRGDFTAAMIYQDFDVTFSTSGNNNLEFRIYYYGYSYLEWAQTAVTEISTFSSPDLLFYGSAAANSHQVGIASGNAWTTKTTDGTGFMTYGPYTQAVPVGVSTATFSLEVDNNSADNGTALRLEVYDTTSAQVLSTRIVRRQNFKAAMTAQDFDLVFEIGAPTTLEFRVYSYGISYIQHLQTLIRPDRASLNSLWISSAHFETRTRDWMGVVSSMVVLDGVWYAFIRQDLALPSCAATGSMQTVVSSSTDHGVTWSSPVVVAAVNGSGPDACVITDGGAFYDTETDTWHMLYQCLGTSGGWNLCHYTRAGISPMGAFTPDANNPVTKGGQLWSQICSGTGKACPPTMVDEGTVQIIKKSGGYFYATFHGANYGASSITGARGVARTLDFVNWEVAGADLPGNAMLSATDCNPWNVNWKTGGCIGTGDASLIRSGGYNYILAEAADMSLGCTVGQNWVFGLLRSSALSPSGSWENYDSNPLVTDLTVTSFGCALQYMTLFRDRGELFLHFGFDSFTGAFPNASYQLVNGSGAAQVIVK